jgi:AcrR family transcriptional regulator
MNAVSRSYNMRSRATAVESTRARIVEAAQALFFEHWYDDVTIAGIAEAAGVSGQTVLNHFGGKEQVFSAAIERAAAELRSRRFSATPGDVGGAIEALVGDYEITGDANVRLLAVEERLPVVAPVMDRGRAGHREWVETMFAAPGLTTELLVATDVHAWTLLRRDQGLTRDETVAAMRRLVEGVLAGDRTDHDTSPRRPR